MKQSDLLKSFKMKNEVVYDYLKANILGKHFKPGDKIIIREISKRLNFSDIPVREAIKKLESQGLINVVPHVGARVAQINRGEMKEIYIMRGTLEELATQLASKYMKEEDFRKLGKILDRYEEAARTGKHELLSDFNRKFHLGIYSHSPYKGLLKMIVELWEKSQMIRNAFSFPSSLRQESIKEHRLILEALKKGNGKEAGIIIRRQKINHWKAISEYIEE